MTLRVFSATNDEATHVGAGLELYQFHRYLVQRGNPPLPRLVFTAAPYLAGMRFDPSGGFGEQLHSVFYGHGKYERNLFLARCGNLLFFALAAYAVWLLSGSVIAVLLFTMEPIVIGYSSLATHDAACVAGFAFALLAFLRWLREPDLKRALLFGAAYGISVLCKFTCIAAVPAACLAIALVRALRERRLPRRVATMFPAAAVTLLVIWGGYAFTTRPFSEISFHASVYGPRVSALLAHLDPRAPFPAPDFFIGIADLLRLEQSGMTAYFCGQRSTDGWIWYFPFGVLIKTSLAALLLFLVGARKNLELVAAALAILVIGMPSKLDLGVRYMLPFYVPFAIVAAAGAEDLIRRASMKWIGIALLVIHCGVSLRAHPDYFPYFNALAGRDPSRYLIDSNLDWGQDALRLRSVIRQLHITRIGLALFGPADYKTLGYPEFYSVNPWEAQHGWIAVSDHSRRMSGVDGGFQWLPEKPLRRIGAVSLYNLP